MNFGMEWNVGTEYWNIEQNNGIECLNGMLAWIVGQKFIIE